MSYTYDSVIFPDLSRPGVHLINHSCEANCECIQYHGHMIYYTLRKIFAGEELTVNYSFPLDEEVKEHYVCKCGAPVCRATMHCTEDKHLRWNDFMLSQDNKHWDKKEVGFGQVLPFLQNYPKEIKDYPIYDIFGNLKKHPLICPENRLLGIKNIRKRIRESGRCLKFNKINLSIYGVMDNMIISCKFKK